VVYFFPGHSVYCISYHGPVWYDLTCIGFETESSDYAEIPDIDNDYASLTRTCYFLRKLQRHVFSSFLLLFSECFVNTLQVSTFFKAIH